MRYIEVQFSDHSVWRIPAHSIADSRARYFATIDSERGDGPYEEVYNSEYTYTINDKYELLDWAANNLNWSDIGHFARRLDTVYTMDYEREWTNARREVIDE